MCRCDTPYNTDPILLHGQRLDMGLDNLYNNIFIGDQRLVLAPRVIIDADR